MSIAADIHGPSSPQPTEAASPTRLLRQFGILSVLSVMTILALAGIGIHRVVSAEMIRVAEQWAGYVANAVFEQDRATFLNGTATNEEFDHLDARMKNFLIAFDMYKIKAFAANKTIIYSTDRKIIGKVESDNRNLETVLTGGIVVSQLEYKDKVLDLQGQERRDLNVVECYVPVRDNGRIVGAFEVYVDITSTHTRIASVVKSALTVLAAVLVAIFGLLYLPMRKGTLGLKKAQEKLTELASIDGLTGIFNRRSLLTRAQEERARMLRAKAETTPGRMSFIMADIDYFKRINDTHGHLVGDAVLKEVSRRLKESLRQYDILGRYGGEEFLTMLPNTSLQEALFVAGRMHEAICCLPVECAGLSLTVTISMGVADTLTPEEEIAHAISRADGALYRAKETGRNRVCHAGKPEAADTVWQLRATGSG